MGKRFLTDSEIMSTWFIFALYHTDLIGLISRHIGGYYHRLWIHFTAQNLYYFMDFSEFSISFSLMLKS